MMISLVIKGPKFDDIDQQISKALPYADLVELRLDYFTSLDLNALKTLRSKFSIPMIFTLRSQLHGGNYLGEEKDRLNEILTLTELQPEYLDLENHVPSHFIQEVLLKSKETKIILSYHNFKETPDDLEEIYQDMQKNTAFFYKIAVTANNCLDAIRLISWAKKRDSNLIAISMGFHGEVSRILGKWMGCPITYAALDEDSFSAPGQLLAKTMIEQYNYHSLNSKTAIYGLIGDPVHQSISDETHNSWFKAKKINAVYVKIQVRKDELASFLKMAKELSFSGLSVTMPLKEEVMPFLDRLDPESFKIGAVNTLLFKEDQIFGFNTDGVGGINVLESLGQVRGKKIVMIGAGGASKAIAYEANKRGALLTILNRDEKKAHQLAKSLHCIGKGLDYLQTCVEDGYDILINCTSAAFPTNSDHILKKAIVMDITTKPKETSLLKIAREKGCRVIYGYQMFTEQALGQFNIWFKDKFDKKLLEKMVIDCTIQLEGKNK